MREQEASPVSSSHKSRLRRTYYTSSYCARELKRIM